MRKFNRKVPICFNCATGSLRCFAPLLAKGGSVSVVVCRIIVVLIIIIRELVALVAQITLATTYTHPHLRVLLRGVLVGLARPTRIGSLETGPESKTMLQRTKCKLKSTSPL